MTELKTNPESLFLDESTARFSGASWFEEVQKQEVLLGGMGGIMSWVALLIARMKPAKLYMYDPDTVEMVNMAGQLYSREDIGQYKVDAVAVKLAEYANYNNVIAIPKKIEEMVAIKNIIITGFDNMTARKNAYLLWQENIIQGSNPDALFIDARLSAEEFQVFAFTGSTDDKHIREEYYNKYLFSDEEAEQLTCSYKQTAYCANLIAGIIANIFVNFCANKTNPGYRTIPFKTVYNAEFMTLDIYE